MVITAASMFLFRLDDLRISFSSCVLGEELSELDALTGLLSMACMSTWKPC